MQLTRYLRNPEESAVFGRLLAAAVRQCNPGALLLYGQLGAGKTTLTRSLVESLPGGTEAEVSSPSFTLCNIYCTAPLVHHFDLYRLEKGISDDALIESFDSGAVLTIVEWPEHMAAQDHPDDGIRCRLLPGKTERERLAELSPIGSLGGRCLSLLM